MIEIRHLTKRFGHLNAVSDLSLSLSPGEILGFLGPNGAGKSTTMKMLTGFLAPDAGQVLINGVDVAAAPLEAQEMIGYLPEGAPSYEDMLVGRFLDFIADVRGLKAEEKARAVSSAVGKMDLQSVLDQRIETLSKGFKRRVGLAQAILHDPEVLILDEPTDGLDPNQKHQVRSLIRGLSRDKIVIISTHILEEVSAVCTRAVILSNGKLLEDCTPADLERRSEFHSSVTVRFSEPIGDEVFAHLETLPGIVRAEYSNGSSLNPWITLFPEAEVRLFEMVKLHCEQQQLPIQDVYQERGRLDDVFRQITAGGTS